MTFEIRTLAKGEKITENGFYNITLDRHHDQPCTSVSVTSGILRKMDPLIGDPAEVWATHKLNPDPWEKTDTEAMKLGRAMAAMVEGGYEELKRHTLLLDRAPRANLPTHSATSMTPAKARKPVSGRSHFGTRSRLTGATC